MSIVQNSGISLNVHDGFISDIGLVWKCELFDALNDNGIREWQSFMYIKNEYLGELTNKEAFDVIKESLENTLGKSFKYIINKNKYLAKYISEDGKPCIIYAYVDETIAYCKPKTIVINGSEYADDSYETPVMDALLALEFFNKERNNDDARVYMRYAFPSQNGVSFQYRDFISSPLEAIRGNYTNSVQEQVDTLLDRMRESENGLIILNGPPGTGKTHLIRAILSEMRTIRSGLICTPPISFLTNLSMMIQAISAEKSSLVVFEDLGDVMTTASSAQHPDVFANLLNVTDGLLSLLNDSLILLSFNTDIGRINPAILRPGPLLG